MATHAQQQPQQLCALVRFLYVVQHPLIEFLELRDLCLLLATCRHVRGHREFVAFALHTNAITRHFYQKRDYDWTSSHKSLHNGYSCMLTHENQDKWTPFPRQLTPAKRASLLSLAGLLTASNTLNEWYYEGHYAYATRRFALPFIRSLPLPRSGKNVTAEELQVASLGEGLGQELLPNELSNSPASVPHVHLASMRRRAETGAFVCGFCEAIGNEIKTLKQEVADYWADRALQLQTLQSAQRANGIDPNSEEYEAIECVFDNERQSKDR